MKQPPAVEGRKKQNPNNNIRKVLDRKKGVKINLEKCYFVTTRELSQPDVIKLEKAGITVISKMKIKWPERIKTLCETTPALNWVVQENVEIPTNYERTRDLNNIAGSIGIN